MHCAPDHDAAVAQADAIVTLAKRRGADVAECTVHTGRELSARVRLGKVEIVEEAGQRCAALRVFRGGRVASTSTTDFSTPGLARLVDDAIALAELSEPDPYAGPAAESLLCTPTDLPFLDLIDPSFADVSVAHAVRLAERAEAAAFAFDPRVTQSQGATVSFSSGVFALALTGGFRGAYGGTATALSVAAIAADAGGGRCAGHHFTSARHLADLEEPESVGREAARRAIAKIGARSIATCEVPVIFASETSTALLASLGGCVTGNAAWRKESFLAGLEGQQIASDMVTVVDDPLLPRAAGARPFDGEGLPSARNVVVEAGRFSSFLCDSYAARKLGRTSTASAARVGGARVVPSTSHFAMRPGDDTLDAIVRGTPRGLLVTELIGIGFNPVTGDLSRGAAGFWVENGERVFPVRQVTVALDALSLFRRIDAVGCEVDARGAVAAPPVRVSHMVVAGAAA